jgi:chromosome segregation ATPase
MSDGKEEFGISPVALDALERDFVEVMKELSAEDNLERFRLEYEKLHRALKKSHDSEKRLIKKCQELHQEITQNAAKVQSALRMSADDKHSVDTLRQEIEKAWKMVDNAHEKESRAKETIQMLKKEVNKLTALVEHGAGLTLGQEHNLEKCITEKRELTKDCENLRVKNDQQTYELRDLVDSVRRLETDVTGKTSETVRRTEAYQQLYKEHENELRKRELAEAKVQDLHKAIEKRTRDIDTLKANVNMKSGDIEKFERELKEDRDKIHDLTIKLEKLKRDYNSLCEQATNGNALKEQQNQEKDLHKQLDVKQAQLERAKSKLAKLNKAVAAQEAELAAQLEEKAAEQKKLAWLVSAPTTEKDPETGELKMSRRSESSAVAIQRIREEMAKEEQLEASTDVDVRLNPVDLGSLDITTLGAVLEMEKRRLEAKERSVKERVRDKNASISEYADEEQLRVALEAQTHVEEGRNVTLNEERDSHKKEFQKLSEQIVALQQQQKQYEDAANAATRQYHESLEKVKKSKREIAERQNDLAEADKRLKNQNAMYEQVLSDRNLYSKNHNEAKEEIDDLEKKFKVMEQQINQLKDELKKRELELCEAHARHETVVKDHHTAESQLKNLERDLKEARGRAAELAEEIKQLTQIIADCDTEKGKQQMKFNSVTNERNILATQLIRRNEELSLLYEKIRIQQSTLLKGESQYRERLVDISMLRKKVHELRTQLRTSLARIRYVEEMRRQVTTLQRGLIRERTKVKALFEELQNPMNVHRWRKLEGSDPAEYENILKLQTLQKRLIAKIEESRQKDLVIREKEKQYTELKSVLARQPGPEIAEQLTVYHENILKRTEQLKRMAEELDANRTSVNELKQEIDRLSGEHQDVKKDFYTLKSKNTLMLRERSLANASLAQRTDAGDAEFVVHNPAAQPRFAGGGFCLSTH